MKKIYLILVAVCATLFANAATEPVWYNDVTSISPNGQYYIYSVGGSGFMKAGSTTVMAATTSATPSLFTIANPAEGTVESGNYKLKVYREIDESSTSGPITTSAENGTKVIFTSMSNGSYWNIHGHYNVMGQRYPALYYKNGEYNAYLSGSGLIWSTSKDTHTETEYRWYVISQAHYARHFAIYAFDSYKETITDYTNYNGNVPAAYYTQLDNAYKQTFDVKNAAHSKEVVEAAQATLKDLYDGAADIKTAYASAKDKIQALENVADKGDDATAVNNDISNAKTNLEAALTVAAINAAVAGLKAIDPITFIAKSTFDALEIIDTIASSAKGQTIYYASSDPIIVNADMKALHKGTVTITATTNGNDSYYPFKRAAQITINGITTYGEESGFVCKGSTFNYEGNEYAEGTHSVTLANRNITGGDSIVSLTVESYPTYNVTDGATICASELPYTWNSVTFTEAGTETLDFTTIHGCDSTVTFTLTVYPEYNVTDGDTICASELPYTWNSVMFTEAGTETLNFTSIHGCDSTVTFTLVVNPTYNVKDSITICPAALPYTWEGEEFTEAGVKTKTLSTVNGCDSVVTFTLKVNTAYEVTDGATICPTELPYTWETVTFTEAGTETLTLQSVVGCDSIVTFTLTVLPTYTVEEKDTMYVGKAKEWHNIDLSVMPVGDTILVDSLQTLAGCDSVIVLNLHVNELPTTYGTVTASVCKGEEFTYNGQNYTAGEYTINTKNVLGGDSIITLTVAELPTYLVELKDTITYGESYTYRGFTVEPDAGSYAYNDSLKTVAGCDSVVSITLLVNKAPQTISWDLPTCYCVFTEGDDVELKATATSGLEVSFAIDNNELAVIENSILKLLKAGDLTITASQEGNDNYLPAEPIEFVMNIQQQPEEAIDNVNAKSDAARKVIINGQIYILRDNVLYDLTGKKQE